MHWQHMLLCIYILLRGREYYNSPKLGFNDFNTCTENIANHRKVPNAANIYISSTVQDDLTDEKVPQKVCLYLMHIQRK